MGVRPLVTLVILAGSLYAADPGLLSLAMPDAQVIAGVNVAQVVLSPLGQYFLTQNQTAAALGKLAEVGFDPQRDLHEILVCGNGQPGSDAWLVLARGTFDLNKIREAAAANGATAIQYQGVEIHQGLEKGQPSIAYLDSTLAIEGDLASVRAAIDRRSAPAAINAALGVEVNQLSAVKDAWFVSLVPPSRFQPEAAAAHAPPALAALNKVQQSSGGVKLGANVEVTLSAISPSPQDAATLGEMLKALAGMAQMAAPKGAFAAAASFLRNLEVSTDGSTTNLSLSVPESQVEAALVAPSAHRSGR